MIGSRLSSCVASALACLWLAGCALTGTGPAGYRGTIHRELFAELTPVRLANCGLKRYGDRHDGGYLMCENLTGDAQAAYSYGIEGRDQWGCDVSGQLRATVHEYDCFDTARPVCTTGTFQFHEECIRDRKMVDEGGRPFDTLSDHLARNGDAGKQLIVKMDVEGDEWASLLATPDSLLADINQLVVEFHHVDDPLFVDVVRKLKRTFYVAHFHANNNACMGGIKPFTSWANEVLLVNKRVGVPDPTGGVPVLPNRLDAPNNPARRDCQPIF